MSPLTPTERRVYLARMNRMACGMEASDLAYIAAIDRPTPKGINMCGFIIPAGLVFCVAFWVYVIVWAIYG